MSNLLITGGAGFIGVNFVRYWRAAHPADRVVVLDSLTYAASPSAFGSLRDDPQFRFVRGDICELALVEHLMRDEAIDRIVHFAAESHVDRSIAGPDAFLQTNILGTHSLLKAARKLWLQERPTNGLFRFHHVSTDEVYGSLQPTAPAAREDSSYAPNSPYAASKAAADHLVRAYQRTYGLPTVTTNCSNNYGPYQHPEKLMPLVIINALEGRALPVYGDGGHIRDWLFVEDHCRGLDAVFTRGAEGGRYNIGGRNEQANIDVVRGLCAAVDRAFAEDSSLRERFPNSPAARGVASEELIAFVADRPGHDRRYALDTGRIERDLGFQPRVPFQAGLARTVRWYLDNEPWWRAIMNGEFSDWVAAHYGPRAAGVAAS